MFRKSLSIAVTGFLILVVAGCAVGRPKPQMFQVTIENISAAPMFTASGVFNTPVGGSSPAPIGPGQAYEFSFKATPGR